MKGFLLVGGAGRNRTLAVLHKSFLARGVFGERSGLMCWKIIGVFFVLFYLHNSTAHTMGGKERRESLALDIRLATPAGVSSTYDCRQETRSIYHT